MESDNVRLSEVLNMKLREIETLKV